MNVYGCDITWTDRKKIREYIEQLESEIKNKEIENLCNECSSIVKESGLTEEDLDRIIAETREIERKAERYDLLIEKLEEAHRIAKTKYSETLSPYRYGKLDVIEEILSFVKGEKDE